jgi:hypothetical protein
MNVTLSAGDHRRAARGSNSMDLCRRSYVRFASKWLTPAKRSAAAFVAVARASLPVAMRRPDISSVTVDRPEGTEAPGNTPVELGAPTSANVTVRSARPAWARSAAPGLVNGRLRGLTPYEHICNACSRAARRANRAVDFRKGQDETSRSHAQREQ